MATWLKVTLNILLAAVLIACSVVITNYSDMFDKSKKYTYQDLQDAYDTGYAKASAVVADLQTKINELESSNSIKTQQIIDLQTQIEILQNTNAELANDNQNKQIQINELQNIITQNEAEIADLKAEIERLKAELEIYANQEQEFFFVTFFVDGEVHDVISVRKGGSILVDIEEPIKYGYVFEHWSDGENEVDVTTYEFTSDMNLYAQFSDFKATININFLSNFDYDGTIAMFNVYDKAEKIYYKQIYQHTGDVEKNKEYFYFCRSGTLTFELPCSSIDGDGYVFEVYVFSYVGNCYVDYTGDPIVVDGSSDTYDFDVIFSKE